MTDTTTPPRRRRARCHVPPSRRKRRPAPSPSRTAPAAATPAIARGVGEPTTAEAAALSTLQGSTAEKIDQLHREMFAGSALGHHTGLSGTWSTPSRSA